jgi:hypothetical protein
VVAEEGEIEEAEAAEEEIPGLVYREDSSDDEDEEYVQSDQEDIPLEEDEICKDYRSADEEEESVRRTRSGRTVKERKYYHDEYQFLQSRGKWAEADAIEKCIAEAASQTPKIQVTGPYPPFLGIITSNSVACHSQLRGVCAKADTSLIPPFGMQLRKVRPDAASNIVTQ